ncbi:MAG: hypothetical protein COW47_01015 [Candidatus Huberarchaeum crystalense]|uniref:4Fe-4S ferredoxin-type domain-containing protein n=1 Tax=Huberarchaeum crystalense TaxID=2014257 RepID=A0A2G9LJK6_HUBC1|nr:4Fe-4S dicluster domain-containing protein [archaeon]PIN66726.1 MAG: hypothetical protein COW69_00780 [Candidatus Huberarchaeum crystalense]PIV13760.1 MAG: hypothetical protein COS45_01115 [Candidatus Huberarchaeum crystalense]PIV46502.1 MAG: hypothetical protein COS22_01030 [Candidatus Huberarchaeum crystalense]PIV89792.1 MAG: hypothetical protein COW47_01015 [Candidatus Huberarchaeum crystalense]
MLKINFEKCVGCRACLSVCFFGAISLKNRNLVIDQKKCKKCGRCVEICPMAAIE